LQIPITYLSHLESLFVSFSEPKNRTHDPRITGVEIKEDEMLKSQQLQHKIQEFQHTIQQLSTMDICNILLAIGLGLLIIGKFERLIMNPLVGIITSLCGYIILLVGIAVFVAIARSVLDY
jgi:hypothetical protein